MSCLMLQNVGGDPKRSEWERPGSEAKRKEKTKKKRERNKIKIGYSIVGGALFHIVEAFLNWWFIFAPQNNNLDQKEPLHAS
jgi:hypothetical protein